MQPRRSWPLVGREVELAHIVAARATGAPGVVVSAAAGIGKSRLAREALIVSERAHCSVAWVQATRSAASVPLGAFAPLLTAQARSDDLFELMERCVTALRTGARGRPLVIGVDDAQWLDPTSAALVLQLATTGTAFVVATVRTGEPCPDAITSLWKDTGAERLSLTELTDQDVERLVEVIVGGPVELGARRWVASVSRGNALYARELTAAATAQGRLAEVDGLWRMPVRQAAGSSLVDLVRGGLADLSAGEHRVLALLAIGEPLPLTELAALSDPGAVERLDDRGLIAVDLTPPVVRLAHPMYGEVVRSDLRAVRGRQIRLALVESVRARDGSSSDDDVLRMVRWLIDAGEPAPADLALRAARAANLAGDPDLGARLAQAALAEAGVAAALVLARSHIVRNRFDDAAGTLDRIEGQIPSPDQAMEFLERQSEVLHWGLKRPDRLRDLLDRACGWWPGPAWARRLEPLLLRVASFERLGLGLDASERLMATDPDPSGGPDGVGPIHVANLFYSGRTEDARALAERVRPTLPLRSLGDVIAVALWARLLLETGEDWQALNKWMRAALDEGVRLSDPATAGQAAYWLAVLRFSAGRYRDAGRLLAQARVHLERHDPVGLLPTATALEVEVACFTDDHARIQSALRRLDAELAGTPALAHQAPYIVRAQAWSAHAEGDADRAQRLLLAAADSLSASPVHHARLAYEALRAGAAATDVAPVLDRLRHRGDARLMRLYAEQAAAQARDDGPALVAVSTQLEAIGALRFAAEACAHAADAFARAGRQDSARRAASRSQSLQPADQGAAPPAITELDHTVVALTRREAQLVKLASRGLTNTQIAEQLVVSVRTVESHLYRAMQKLGVNNRQDL